MNFLMMLEFSTSETIWKEEASLLRVSLIDLDSPIEKQLFI